MAVSPAAAEELRRAVSPLAERLGRCQCATDPEPAAADRRRGPMIRLGLAGASSTETVTVQDFKSDGLGLSLTALSLTPVTVGLGRTVGLTQAGTDSVAQA